MVEVKERSGKFFFGSFWHLALAGFWGAVEVDDGGEASGSRGARRLATMCTSRSPYKIDE